MPNTPVTCKCSHLKSVHVLGVCFGSVDCNCDEFSPDYRALSPTQYSEPIQYEGETFIACRFVGETDHWFKLQGASDEREPEFPEIDPSEIVWL